MERSAFAAGDQHSSVGVVNQLVKSLYFLERGNLGVGGFRGNWIEFWIRHDGGLRGRGELVGMVLYAPRLLRGRAGHR